ncbi:hypothetical protein jhhlp_005815 [Lomentospora prolificans]|uniref:Uncharacterized protein n=1 Tax=Lomentospora prolificans TaxID=41688 RepID=A0A2N3N458_9PEZI|nr:hypothetical protein jhhlp_005815 [Lomentospora prolificans]
MSNTTTFANDTAQNVVGWVSTSKDRGTADIVWSSCVTILLCVVVATHTSVPSREDKWYHYYIDKFNLAFLGCLGPEFLLAIALGRYLTINTHSQLFKDRPDLRNGQPWTLAHGFYSDTGGFLLITPDYPKGFPINAEQLFYLVDHGHVDFPALSEKDIKNQSRADSLSKYGHRHLVLCRRLKVLTIYRVITLFQVLWFTITEIRRTAAGYPMTTLELTALTYAFIMVATSVVWYRKPSISQPTLIHTKNYRSAWEIRNIARSSTHPNLPIEWFRTPVDFISRRYFHFDLHWAYYYELTYKMRLPLISRPITARPWDRFPSNAWFPPEGWVLIAALFVQIPFSVSFLIGWNFYFASEAEKWLWRVASIYHALFTLIGTYYYIKCIPRELLSNSPILRVMGGSNPHSCRSSHSSDDRSETFESLQDAKENASESLLKSPSLVVRWYSKLSDKFKNTARNLQNLASDGDPEMTVKVQWMLPILLPTFFYVSSRMYFFIEDFVGLREQPAEVYLTVSRFLPFV